MTGPPESPLDPLQAAAVVAVAFLLGFAIAWLLRRGAAAAAAGERERRIACERALALAEAGAARADGLARAHEAERDRRAEAERDRAEADARAEFARADSARLERALAEANDRFETARAAHGGLSQTLAAMRETLAQERRASGEKLALLRDARDGMGRDFRALADEILSRHGETFGRQNREQIDHVLAPLRERIGEFAQGLASAREDGTRERATLGEQIRTLAATSARMSHETVSLTRALRGESQVQGAWGEMILGSILERCGLREGDEFTAQASHTNEEGRRLRPDVVVRLPGEGLLVIDAKVSLRDYETFSAEGEAATRDAALRRHLAAMRAHVRELSQRDYPSSLPGDLDVVVMFVPIEGALAAAVRLDPELTRFAIEQNVAIATPTTLMLTLRTVASVWRIERRNRNAEDIADRAGRLYAKFVGLLEDLQKLGGRIDQSHAAWRDAMGKLSTGPGNLVRQIEVLKALGARTTKSIPAGMLGDE